MSTLSELVSCLMDIVRRNTVRPASQTAAVCQLSVLGLQLLCRLLGARQPLLFTAHDTDSVSSHSSSASSGTAYHPSTDPVTFIEPSVTLY